MKYDIPTVITIFDLRSTSHEPVEPYFPVSMMDCLISKALLVHRTLLFSSSSILTLRTDLGCSRKYY